MKTPSRTLPRVRFLIALAIPLFAALHTRAAETPAGTSIANQATINYQVGGVAQTAVTSNSLAFVVDRKINLTVTTTDGAAVSVSPGSATNILAFTVQNTGNGTQDFHVSAVARSGGSGAFGGTDNVNAAAVTVYRESGATAGYQSGQDTATYIDELAANGTATVYIVGDFSSGTYTNADVASYHLVQARLGGTASSLGGTLTETSGADAPGAEDTVFADGQGSATSNDAARDSKFSDDSDFVIATATLGVTKTSAVISDPTNNTTNPKAIPGAVVEYTVTIANTGSSSATSVVFTDSLNAAITAGTIAFSTNGYSSGKGIQVTAPNINSGSAKELTNAGSDDEGDWNVTATNTITVTGITLAASQTATIKFRVIVQ